MLTYWETYVAGLEYLCVFLIPLAAFTLLVDRGNNESGAGCLIGIVGFVLQGVALLIVTISLSPIILGFSSDAAWTLPWTLILQAPWGFATLVLILLIATFLFGLIPFFGSKPSLLTLVLGGITLAFIIGMLKTVSPDMFQGPIDYVPGVWFSVGLIIVGGFMSWAGMIVATAVGTVGDILAGNGIGQLLAVPLSAAFGFVPVFIYGAWLGAQIRGGF